VVVSSLEHLRVIGKREQALGKAEVHGAVLTMVTHRVDERRRDLAVAETAMWPYRGVSEGRDGTRR
jgi:hypothetical protein